MIGYRDDIVTDGVGDNTENYPAIPGSSGTSREKDPTIPGSSGTSTGYRDDIVTDGVGDNTENDPAIPGSSGTSRAEIGEVSAAFRSVQLVRQPLLYSANDGASAAFNSKSLSGDQGAAQISQCFAVICSDTSSDGNNGGIGPSSGLTGPAPAELMGPAPAGLLGPAPAGLMGPAPAGLIGPAPAPSHAQDGAQQRGAPAIHPVVFSMIHLLVQRPCDMSTFWPARAIPLK
ncbi:hypothetical protein OS493_007742 [Desmophyllum pertusum]|uniref:Uncharacterized protein n=1 Tax=Desmophyllum pertusum TaxID=174260 RepID=A0A9W9YRW5_9CNID|nr:hypothetical protein OS493_007742 [Desmophyllum pertusum]